MSEAKSKQELVRLAWIAALRREGHRQCFGFTAPGGRVCAMALLEEVLWGAVDRMKHADEAPTLAGLTTCQMERVVCLNDGVGDRRHTFAEIADVIEGWFSKPIDDRTNARGCKTSA